MALRFHWSMSSAGERHRGARSRAATNGLPDVEAHIRFCRHAEACGIDSLLTAVGFHRSDPITLAAGLGMATKRVRFLIAVRSGLYTPPVFVQQINTLSALTGGRVCINVVAGHTPAEQRGYGDFLAHDERYARTDEFLTVCRRFWEGEQPVTFEGKYYHLEAGKLNTPFSVDPECKPEIYVAGSSPAALELAARHADCLFTIAEPAAQLAERVATVLESGTEVGLLVSLIARPTRGEALAATEHMLEEIGEKPRTTHRDFASRSDSQTFGRTLARADSAESGWLSHCLWNGAVPYLGAPAIALVGSYEDVAEAILEYQQVGVSQFLFMGWPDLEEMTHFRDGVQPLLAGLSGRATQQTGMLDASG